MTAITITAIPGTTRYVRAMVLNLVSQDYIEAARACGTGSFGIMFKHILPNAFGPLVYAATNGISGMIMVGAGLSFLGLGIQPPYPEWGVMLAEARDYLLTAPWLFFVPATTIVLAMLSFNLVGDTLRDTMDPKLRR